jgi:hypothetical protein
LLMFAILRREGRRDEQRQPGGSGNDGLLHSSVLTGK